jgi:hypothetical protein
VTDENVTQTGNPRIIGDSGFERKAVLQSDPDARFWHILGRKIAHGPAVRIPDNYDGRRPGQRWRG